MGAQDAGDAASSPTAELPEDLRAALASHASAIGDISLQWKTTRSAPLGIDELFGRLGLNPPGDGGASFFAPEEIAFVQKEGKVRFRYEYSNSSFIPIRAKDSGETELGETQRTVLEITYDGEKFYRGLPYLSEDMPGTLAIDTVEDAPTSAFQSVIDVDLERPSYFYQAGLKAPTSIRDFQTPELRSLILDLLAEGYTFSSAKDAGDAGQFVDIELSSTARNYRFRLDKNRGHAVVSREEFTPSGGLIARAEMLDFRQVDSRAGVWLPHRCSVKNYQWGGRPATPSNEVLVGEEFEVLQVTATTAADNEFVLSYEIPGLAVADGTLENADKSEDGFIHYVMPADPADLDEAIRRAIEGKPQDFGGDRFRSTVILLNIVVVILVGLALLWSRKKRSSATS